MTTVGSICSFLNGGTPSRRVPRYYKGNVPWITGADISGPRADSARSFITEEAIRKSATNRVPAGTVLLVTRTSVGKVAVAAMELCFSQDITAIIPDSHCLDTSYLVHFLRTKQPHLERQARGATIKGVTREVVANLPIPLPPLREQQRLADILDRADALRAKRRATLAQLDTLTQSIFLDMFGDAAASGWHMTNIDGVAAETDGAIRTGPFGSQLLHSEFTEEGIAVLGIDNAVENEFRWGQRRFISEDKYRQLSTRYTVNVGDVLITIMGTCGRCAIVPDDIPRAVNTKHLCCITLDRTKCLPVFLHAYFLQHPIARRYLARKAKGAIMRGLNMGIIRDMPIPQAPIDLQEEYAEIVKAVGSVKRVQRQAEAEVEALLNSLQYHAFRGEL